ncbi:DUF262 domain-containing protein [Dactylosporangium sp. NPDC048998]|uniref:DUF262 domain-containing protein n=1 Tax=Dactylosporangium sp. NPDC048998 TaxID=3363976 RepID=UPI0037150C63
MKTTATNKKVREIMADLANDRLVPRPEFQRRLVWTQKHKQAFIRTVLEGLPFPEIFLCDGEVDLTTGEGQRLVVDGQQRVTTLFQYFTSSPEFTLGDLKAYSDLADEEKRAYLNYEVVVRDLGTLTEDEVREVFHRMNSTNYGLNAIEVNNARFAGPLKELASSLSEEPFFEDHKVFNVVDIRRMRDVGWCLTLLITFMSGYFNRDTEHENFLRRHNDELLEADDLRGRIDRAIQLAEALNLGEDSRAWQKADLLTLLTEIDRSALSVDDREAIEAAGTRLRGFYSAVEAVNAGEDSSSEAQQYHAAVISGSNERARRLRRGSVIAQVLSGEATATA